MEEIEHHATKIRNPRPNGSGERMIRTLLDECLRAQDVKPGTTVPLISSAAWVCPCPTTISSAHTTVIASGVARPAQVVIHALDVTEIRDIIP
jgi:hypothetical protein